MSIPTPEFIAETVVWDKYKQPLISAANDSLKRLEELEELTTEKRLAKLQNTLKLNKSFAIDPTCVRETSNWSSVKPHHKFDNPAFNAELTANELKYVSPKLDSILKMIKKVDREDEARYGRRFKHFIFSDIRGSKGAKAVAAALISEGYNLGYNITKKGKNVLIDVKSPAELKKTEGRNFFLLSSVSMYTGILRVPVKKEVLSVFNSRPDNVYGELAHIIVMDSGFKEGIDLFDIKYIHIFEPQTNAADQKQVIGRGTRTCGQKGLLFNPRVGWPLYVFKYDLSIDPQYSDDFRGSNTAFNYYLKSKNIDVRLINLASNIERLTIKGSVDYKLNQPIHNFSSDKDVELSRGGNGSETTQLFAGVGGSESPPNQIHQMIPGPPLMRAEDRLGQKLEDDSIPGKKYEAVKKYIKKYFSEYTWPPVKMENLCGYEGPILRGEVQRSLDIHPTNVKIVPENRRAKSLGGSPKLITLSPTQDFISNYFSVANPIKGMVLWQSVGTGKTCTAIATATRQFEPQGYTILWVTRTTLKNDIWKNMFDMVCHEDIRDKVDAGVSIPNNMPGKMRLLSKAWGIRPLSYKQFSNLVSKNNQYYDKLVKRNGEDDPLRKTLIIIDEAHKLYGGGDLSSIERPDMDAFHKSLMHSYEVSGKDSVRVMFMTATPITESPLELVKLVNLCKPADKQMPSEFELFANKYLDDDGDFTDIGSKKFLDDIAGHISYLNREGDVRQFSRPILREVEVPLVNANIAKQIEKFDLVGTNAHDRKVIEVMDEMNDFKTKYETRMKDYTEGNISKVYEVCDEYQNDGDAYEYCHKIAKKQATNLKKDAKDEMAQNRKELKEIGKGMQLSKQLRTSKLRDIRENRTNHSAKYEKYKESPYYKLKECETKVKDAPNLESFLETQPAYSVASELEKVINQEKTQIENQFKSDLSSQQSKLKSYSKLLKTMDLEPIETRVVKSSIADLRNKIKTTKKINAKWLKRVTHRADSSIKQLADHKKEVKKQIKDLIKNDIRDGKQILREENKLLKLEKIADEFLSEEFKDKIREAKNEVKKEVEDKCLIFEEKKENQRKKEEKKREAKEAKMKRELENAEKHAANVTRKQRIELEKEAKKKENATRKQRIELEKEAKKTEQQAKKTAIQNEKEQKQREKEQKQREKEQKQLGKKK
jgi:hypothetical protein